LEILVIAAHPDDEVLGMGATIKKKSKKNKIRLCVVSEGASAQYVDKKMIDIRRDACKKCSKTLGIASINFLDFPDMRLDSIPQVEINKELEKIIKKYHPKIVFTTPPNDVNKDHEIVFDSTMIATRPYSNSVKQLLCYEIPGISKKQFSANVYEDIEKEFQYKINGFKYYKSEIQKFPYPRSIKAIENLAIFRGVQAGLKKAEAFNLIRSIQ
jgi:LmbE family N-acetylglucosaminyl deacetylase